MRRGNRGGIITGVLGLAALAGCGAFQMPEATTPPEWAVIGERAPAFTVQAEDPDRPGALTDVDSADFLGHVLVAIGAEPGFVGEAIPWLDALEERYGPPRSIGPARGVAGDSGRYHALVILERAKPGWLARLEGVMPEGLTLLVDQAGEFANAPEGERSKFGFVGEGPHVAVISADGTLLALIDGPASKGPASKKRLAELEKVMDRALPALDVSPGPQTPAAD